MLTTTHTKDTVESTFAAGLISDPTIAYERLIVLIVYRHGRVIVCARRDNKMSHLEKSSITRCKRDKCAHRQMKRIFPFA